MAASPVLLITPGQVVLPVTENERGQLRAIGTNTRESELIAAAERVLAGVAS